MLASVSWSCGNVGLLVGRKLHCATCRDTRLPVALKVQRKSRGVSWRIRIRSEEEGVEVQWVVGARPDRPRRGCLPFGQGCEWPGTRSMPALGAGRRSMIFILPPHAGHSVTLRYARPEGRATQARHRHGRPGQAGVPRRGRRPVGVPRAARRERSSRFGDPLDVNVSQRKCGNELRITTGAINKDSVWYYNVEMRVDVER